MIETVGYDCPMFEDVYECVSAIAGGTIAAAEVLKTGQASIAINWNGGWHHAQRYSNCQQFMKYI